jgi:hypothetical protein
MKLQKWAMVAEIVGAIAVVISLVYVGVGIRQNTDAIMSTNHQNLLALDIDKNSWFRDPDFAALYESALIDIDGLSAPQLRQFSTYVSDQMNIWEDIYITHEKGLIDDRVWEGYDEYYSSQLRLPSYRQIWAKKKDGWTGEFARHAESVLADVETE